MLKNLHRTTNAALRDDVPIAKDGYLLFFNFFLGR